MAVPGGPTALGAGFVNPFQYLQNKFTEKDDLTWTKGSHTLRIGGVFQRQQLNPFVQVFWNGFYIFQSRDCRMRDRCSMLPDGQSIPAGGRAERRHQQLSGRALR